MLKPNFAGFSYTRVFRRVHRAMATAERAAASAVVTSAAEVDALVYEHLLARGYVATAKSLQAEAREEEAETASTDWVSDLHMFVQVRHGVCCFYSTLVGAGQQGLCVGDVSGVPSNPSQSNPGE